MTIKEAFDFGLKQKEKILSATTKRGYVKLAEKSKSGVNLIFLNYLHNVSYNAQKTIYLFII